MTLPAMILPMTCAAMAIVSATTPDHDQPAPETLWVDEAPVLTHHLRLTSPEQFARAGEAYFDPTGSRIVFQANLVPAEGETMSPHYGMYVADLVRDDEGHVTGLGDIVRVSPEGSANTCGWFHPTDPTRLLFGSTVTAPAQDKEESGYQRGTSKYVWQFPSNMNIVEVRLTAPGEKLTVVEGPTPIFDRPGYDAEGSWSADGRTILYTNTPANTGDGDLWLYDTETGEQHPGIIEKGYDGGPFFSPTGERVCYRSDREGNDLLQLYTADVVWGRGGVTTGLTNEEALTDNEHVNWAPYWHPSELFLVYATSEVGHTNYEVFAIDATPGIAPSERAHARVTHAAGFDGLPVFTRDGSLMMWTSQRTDEGGQGTSQLWIASFDFAAAKRSLEREGANFGAGITP